MTEARLQKDEEGHGLQALQDGGTVTAAITTASVQTTVAGSNIVRVVANQDCHIARGSNPTATTSSMLLPRHTVEYFHVTDAADKLAVIRATADGTLFMTDMD